jgi:hypothetical protein
MTEQRIEVRALDGKVFVATRMRDFTDCEIAAALRAHYEMRAAVWPDAQSVTFTEQEKAEPIYSRKREARPRDVFG